MVEATRHGVNPATRYSERRYSVGVDLGQASDYSAIAVLERVVVGPETALFNPVGAEPGNRLVEGSVAYNLVYLRRVKLGTPYDLIAERVADLCVRLEPRGAFDEIGDLVLSVDGTGVGRGVVDLLRRAFAERQARAMYTPKVDFRPVTVTGGNSTLKRPSRTSGYWSVPKRDLIFPCVACFQQKRLRIARGIEDKDALVQELKSYRRAVNIQTGNQVFEPWRESDHDDLLFAVCLSLWGWQTRNPGTRKMVVIR